MFSKKIDSQIAIIPFIILGILFGVAIGMGFYIWINTPIGHGSTHFAAIA